MSLQPADTTTMLAEALTETPTSPLTHAVTFHGLYWPSAHSAGAPFADAHVHSEGKTFPLAGFPLDYGRTLCDLPLVESIRWDQVNAAAIVHMPNKWETLLVAGEVDGAPVMVSVPTAALHGQGTPPELGRYLAGELQILVNSARMRVTGDNLDELLATAVTPPSTQAPSQAPARTENPAAPRPVIRLDQPRRSIFTQP